MPETVPFRALRYNLNRVGDIAGVVTPPYDVISAKEVDSFYAESPYNIIRLDLGRPEPGDNGQENVAVRAGRYLREWTAGGVLTQDREPSFYLCETVYVAEGVRHTRRGFIGCVLAEPFGGAIRRHELTFPRVKEGRLKLISEARANISPVFGLYHEPEDRALGALAEKAASEPDFSFTDSGGCAHRLSRVSDRETVKLVSQVLKERRVILADGHHRYETAVAYADIQRREHPDAPKDAAFNFIMMYLVNSAAPGLTILPTHRLLAPPEGFSVESFSREAEAFFEIETLEGQGSIQLVRERLAQAGSKGTAFAVYVPGSGIFRLLRLKHGVMEGDAGADLEPSIRHLDVTVFSRVVLQRLLHFNSEDDERAIEYSADATRAIETARSNGRRIAFLLNPTWMEQVQAVADQGLTMPRKSTYFYPKVMTGLTIHRLSPEPEGT